MRRIAFFLISLLFSLAIDPKLTMAQLQKEVKSELKTADRAPLLPASLDNFFPPKADQPFYLFRMLGMNKSFTGVVVDLLENDVENARTNFEEFKTQYLEVSKLVPEWESYFPAEPLDELGRALETGNQEKVLAAIDQVGKVCTNCHIPNVPKVQYKYFWGDFQSIRITDPLTNREVNNQQLMQLIDASFTGIEVDVEQGQIENAQRHLQDFRARFQAMEETCMNCHDTERHYYVDESVKAMIDKLGQALSTSPDDLSMISKLSQGIGMESCFKCHLVHLPAAAAQRQVSN